MSSHAACTTVVVDVSGREPGRIMCPRGTSVLRAMVAAGLRHLPVGCRSGGCGVCRVRVEHGEYTLGRMSATQVDADAADRGIALACRLFPTTDLRITTIGHRPAGDSSTRNQIDPTNHLKENP